jgi:hypothetical protein
MFDSSPSRHTDVARISVLSAGNAGQAFAGGLTLSGNDVHLAAVPEHAEPIRVIQSFGGDEGRGQVVRRQAQIDCMVHGGFEQDEPTDIDQRCDTCCEMAVQVGPHSLGIDRRGTG